MPRKHSASRWFVASGMSAQHASLLARTLYRRLSRHWQPPRPTADDQRGLIAWAQHYLPHHFSRKPSRMHRWLDEQLMFLQQHRGNKLNVIGPRGSAKSTVGSLAWPLRLALTGAEPYIWIVSDTAGQACNHLQNIKTELIDNAALAADYPTATGRGSPWSQHMIMLNNGVVIEAFGSGQRIRGRRCGAYRPTLIIADDLQNDQNIESAEQRDRSRQWFHGALLRAGTQHTNVIHLATALHSEALALELDRTPGWKSQVFRAIERWPDNMDLWQQWESLYADVDHDDASAQAQAFYDEHRAAMDQGAELLWPEEEDLYTLMRMRVEGGRSAFEREKQGTPILSEACEWPEAYFDPEIWFEQWPACLKLKVLALDPSKGSDASHGDYSAYVMLGIDARGVLYVEADLARRPTPQMVSDGVAIYRAFQPQAFGIEANQFQELLGGLFVDEFQRAHLHGAQPWLMHNTISKVVRLRRLGPYLSNRRLKFKQRSPGTRMLVQQLREFPLADHDDGPDALEMAIRLATELFHGDVPSDGLGARFNLSV